jgi:hypothetical protein
LYYIESQWLKGDLIMSGIVASFKTSAHDWNISTRTAWLIFGLPIVGAILLPLTRANQHLYDMLTMEDGPIEWVQFVFYSLTVLASLGVAIKRLQAGHQWQALLFLGLALANFFIAGEEIAWGQRIFGLQTPEQLREINHQGEITVHNIQIIQDAFNVVLFCGGLYGVFAYFVNERLQVQKHWSETNYLFIPPLFTVGPFFVLFLYKLIRYTVWRTPGFTITRYAEWSELCLAFALFVFTWLNYRRLATKQTPPIAARSAARNVYSIEQID